VGIVGRVRSKVYDRSSIGAQDWMLVVISLSRFITLSPETKALLIESLIFKRRPDCVGSTCSKTAGHTREGSLQLH